MGIDSLRIGSRGSELALWQARWVERKLSGLYPALSISIQIIKTTGDRVLDAPLSKIGDKGLFTREIEHALLSGEIDLAVHSLKDLPTALPEGLMLGAVCEREDVRDVFIPHPGNAVRTLREQPEGSKVATGSLRRKCQLLALRPDFTIVDIRGNLNTRMKKLDESGWAGMMLAQAGVVRLGWDERIGESLDPLMILPAVGQGALGIEIRENDPDTLQLLQALHHEDTAAATRAERSLLKTLEGGCQVPIGTYGRVSDGTLSLDAMVGSLDGKRTVRGTITGPMTQAEQLGEKLASRLLVDGADKILGEIRQATVRGDA
jgi:hydroxymethylbilane synthase